MGKTSIEWTQATWNPVRGCSPVSPGCKNCYAERVGGRFCKPGAPFDGFVQIGKNGDPGPHWTGKVELMPHMLDLPLRTKKPTTWFVNSMSDLFHGSLSYRDRVRVFDVMREASWHTYQILTKRSEIMRDFMQWWVMQHMEQPPTNWWLGVSVEDQQRAAVRFVSAEPLLGPVDLRMNDEFPDPDGCYADARHGLDWVIVGGESGPGARPFNLAWAEDIVSQCKDAGVPVFVKQVGANPIDGDAGDPWRCKDRKGGEPSEWPQELRVRQMPEVKQCESM